MLINNAGKGKNPFSIRPIRIKQCMTEYSVRICHGIDMTCVGSLCKSIIRGIPT